MVEMAFGLKPGTISALQFSSLLILVFVRVTEKFLVQEEIPDPLSFALSIEGFILGVTDPTELLVGAQWLRSVALPN
jgi:hypothetical protein